MKALDLAEWEKLAKYEGNMGGNVNRACSEVEAATLKLI